MPTFTKYVLISVLTMTSFHSGVYAQSPQTQVNASNNPKTAGDFELDLNTPLDPGFVVIGASPKGAADPGNFKNFAISTAGFFESGKFKPGLAVSALPYWWKNHAFSLEQYASELSRTDRIFARTQLSLATVEHKGAGGKSGAKLGIGFQSQLLDDQDPRLDSKNIRCVRDTWKPFQGQMDTAINEAIFEAQTASAQDASADIDGLIRIGIEKRSKGIIAAYDTEYSKCKKAAEKRFLRSPSLMVGAGLAGLTESGKSDDLEFDGASFWTTYRRPFGAEKKALVFFIKADVDRDFEVAPKQIAKGDGFEIAVSYVLEQPTWKLDATASFHYRDFKNSKFDDDHFRYSVTGAYKLKENVWFETTWGTKTNSKTDDENFGLVNLKTNLGEALSKLTQ